MTDTDVCPRKGISCPGCDDDRDSKPQPATLNEAIRRDYDWLVTVAEHAVERAETIAERGGPGSCCSGIAWAEVKLAATSLFGAAKLLGRPADGAQELLARGLDAANRAFALELGILPPKMSQEGL